MYIICLASALQHIQLPVKQQGQAATATDTTQPTAEVQSTVNQASAPSEAAASAPLDSNMQVSQTRLLEKAFKLYQDTCLSSDPQHSWSGLVEPSLHDALTFHRPDTHLLSDAAIDPGTFHSYAVAYIDSLGSAGHGDKLSSIQHATRRQMRRTNASAEACQSLFTAATAALQAAYDKELSNLESQVDSAVQAALQQPSTTVNHAAAAESSQPVAHVDSESQAASAQESDSHQLNGDTLQDPSAEGSREQAAAGPSGAADLEQPNKELLTTLLAFLKKLHVLSRPVRGADARHGLAAADDTANAELLGRYKAVSLIAFKCRSTQHVCLLLTQLLLTMARTTQTSVFAGCLCTCFATACLRLPNIELFFLCRAYTSYLRLWYPKQSLTTVPPTDAASGVDNLLQQSKSGIDPPKPPLPDSQQQQEMPVSTIPNVSWMSLHGASAV